MGHRRYEASTTPGPSTPEEVFLLADHAIAEGLAQTAPTICGASGGVPDQGPPAVT